jgi:hypothetical protein
MSKGKHRLRVAALILVGTLLVLVGLVQVVGHLFSSGGDQPGMGMSTRAGQFYVHIARCLLPSVSEITISEDQGGSRTANEVPIYWQVRRVEGRSALGLGTIRVGEAPPGFVTTVPLQASLTQDSGGPGFLFALDVDAAGSMTFDTSVSPSLDQESLPSDGRIRTGDYRVQSSASFDQEGSCRAQGALIADGPLAAAQARAFASASDPLRTPPHLGRVVLDMSSKSYWAPGGAWIQADFLALGAYRVFGECTGISMQVSDAFAPTPDEFFGRNSVLPCKGGWIQAPSVDPKKSTQVAISVLAAPGSQWRVLVVAEP